MGYPGSNVTDILREFEKSFKIEDWRVYPSSEMGACLIEDEFKHSFYVITGSDSDSQPISLKRLEKAVTRYSKYKGKKIDQVIYLAHNYSDRVIKAIQKGNFQGLNIIEFDTRNNRVDLLSKTNDLLLAVELKTFLSKYLSDHKNWKRKISTRQDRSTPNYLVVKEYESGLEITLFERKDDVSEVIKYSENEPQQIKCDSKPIKLLAFSDWRIQNIDDVILFLKQTEPFDLLVYAGDDIGRFQNFEENLFTLLASYTKTKFALAVLGNDDDYEYSKRILKEQGIINLYENSLLYGDYAFIGLESSTSGPAVFLHSENDFDVQLKTQSKKVKGKKLVIISHTPPFGVLDSGIRFAPKEEGIQNIGSTALRNFLESQKVETVICGHCHSMGGNNQILNGTNIINVASHDNRGSIGRFAIITLSPEGVEVEWHDTLEVLPKNSVRRVYGVGESFEKRLGKAGIETVEQLSKIVDLEKTAKITSISQKILWKFKQAAKSMLSQEIYQINTFNVPSEKFIFVDIETDVNCERVWLIGLLIDGHFNQLYADNWDQERSILENFIKIIKEHPGYTLVSYSGTNFDYRVPLAALRRHGLDADFLASYVHIDLCNEIRNCFVFPHRSFKLKEFGYYQGYPFKHGDLDGLWVAMEYHRHVNNGTPLDMRVFKYNEDDVRAIPFLIERCYLLKSESKIVDFVS